MRYAVVIEKAEGNYSAYVPDLPGCVATGATVKAWRTNFARRSDFTWQD
jgi:predicted RNase H-like HicB family nuclease